jgi:hypothetical protein
VREEHGQTVLGNRALREICGPKRTEVTEDRCKLHSNEPYYLYKEIKGMVSQNTTVIFEGAFYLG